MSVAPGSTRQRGGQNVKKASPAAPVAPTARDARNDAIPNTLKPISSTTSEWDYKFALALITVLAFVTRFWGIGHPNEVVFDEVHFGKVHPYFGNGSEKLLTSVLTRGRAVCVILPSKNLFFRRASSFWQASVCPHGLVRWL